MAAKKTYVLVTNVGPVAAGDDLDALKAHGEKLIAKIVGATQFKWEPVEKAEEDDPDNRLGLYRKAGPQGRWIYVGQYIDEVPVVGAKKAKS